jgi:protein SCO1/2
MTPRVRILAIVGAVAIGVALGLAVSLWLAPQGGGATFAPAAIGGPFTLTDQNGQPRTDRDFRGRLMLVTFGYTHCPDVCPLTVAAIGETLDRLGPQADQVAGIFVSVDPQRDTPAVLREYVASVSDKMVALTGTPEQVQAAARAYRVYYRIGSDAATNPNYSVDHTALFYLMDREGRFVQHFTHQAQPDVIVAAIRRAL